MATILNTTQIYSGADVVTHTNLNQIIGGSLFVAGVGGTTDDVTLEVDSTEGFLKVKEIDTANIKNSSIVTDKIADSSSKTTGVTFAKMQYISTAKVLGRITAGEGDVEEAFDFKDEDDMSSDSDTALASQQSIKSYVDNTAIFTQSFESAEQDIPAKNAAVLAINHGLGEIPKLIEMVYRCKNNDGGWIAGDEIVAYSQSDSGQGDWSVIKNATQVKFRGTNSIRRFAHGTLSNQQVYPTSPNWKIVFRAYA